MIAADAGAVLIAGADGSLNTTPPTADPGFLNVGSRGGATGVYVRNGWVLTAAHVGIGPIVLDGIQYAPVPNSETRFESDGNLLADLVAFKLQEVPPLSDLEIARRPPVVGESLLIVGNGESRGASTVWSGVGGWDQVAPRRLRWGTNAISVADLFELNTAAFELDFSELTGPYANHPEAQAVEGDSGGAVFATREFGAELIGILFARRAFEGQPLGTALFGNVSLAVDLDDYRAQILDVIDQPDCDDGLDDDGDGLIDFPGDPGCLDAFDRSEVPEPRFAAALFSGALALRVLRRRARVRESVFRDSRSQ